MASPVGGQFIFGPPSGAPAVTPGLNDGTNPIFPAPVSGNYNIEVFTAVGITAPGVAPPALDSGFQAEVIDPNGTLVPLGTGGALTGDTLQLFGGTYALTDAFVPGSGQTPANIILGSGNQTVVGAPGDTLQGGSGTQILNALTQFSGGPETIIGGSGSPDLAGGGGGNTVFGGPGDSVVGGSGNTYIDGTAGKMHIDVGSRGVDIIVGNAATNTISGASAGPDTLSGGSAAVQVQGLGQGDIVSFGNQTGNASINATVGNIIATLGGGAATLFGGRGDFLTLGSVGQYLDGGAGAMTIKLGSGGVDSVFGTSVTGAGDTLTGAGASLNFNPQVGGGNDLLNLSGSSANATINAFSAGGTQLTAVGDTIMAGTGSDSVWGGPGDRIGVGTSSTAGGTHTFDHSTTVTGAPVAFGTNDSVASSSTAQVTVTNFTAGADSLFYQNETTATNSSIVTGATTTGGNTILQLPDGTTMTIVGITTAELATLNSLGALFKP